MSSQTVYSVATFHDGHYMMTSNCFETKTTAQEFMDYCSEMDTSKFTFQMYTHKSSGLPGTLTTNKSNSTLVPLYSNMTLERFGKGLLLRPDENCEFHGQKYFMDGWWMSKHEAWFFKEEHFDELISHGAEYISDYPLGHIKFESEEEVEEEPAEEFVPEEETDNEELEYNSEVEGVDYGEIVNGLTLESYGKGYMLYPDSSKHSHYGEKYLGNGWWNRRANGWFFREMYLQELLDAGAMLVSDHVMEPCSTNVSELVGKSSKSTRSTQTKGKVHFESTSPSLNASKENGSWTTYGRGWLLTPTKTHSKYGHKIYKGGWWMPQHTAWFFKNSVAKKL
jgi:hypothetical protein